MPSVWNSPRVAMVRGVPRSIAQKAMSEMWHQKSA